MAKLDVNRTDILKGIHSGKYTPKRLPVPLYEATADVLLDAVSKGYGDDETKSDEDILEDLTENILLFSGAKTFQQTNEMFSELRDENGDLISLAAFLVSAGSIFDKYNDTWLSTEMETSEWAAKSASNWIDFTESKNDNPYLEYHAEEDGHTCDICAPLDGIIIDINDSFWDENATPQHFYCRCNITEVTGIEQEAKNSIVAKQLRISTKEEITRAVKKSQKHKDKLFNYNPGKDRVIFRDKGRNKHPYFDIPAEFKQFAGKNFGLPLPKLKDYAK